MRRPCMDTEKLNVESIPQGSSANFARMGQFVSDSIGRISASSPINYSGHPSTNQSLLDLRNEGQMIFGKPLEDLMNMDDKGLPYGIPSFVNQLCRRMLEYGVSFEMLVDDNWCSSRCYSEEGLLQSIRPEFSSNAEAEAAGAADLFRLFLEELPQPLMCERTVASLTKLYKDLENFGEDDDLELFDESAFRIRNILYQRLPWYTLQFLQFLMAFLHQLRTTTSQNTCPVATSSLSQLLGRVLTKNETSLALAKMLLLNYPIIFQEMDQFINEKSNSSDSVSSTGGDSRDETTDDADLLTPEEEGCLRDPWLPNGLDAPDDDSTTTTDTDDFRSPPVSPIKFGSSDSPSFGVGSKARLRADEIKGSEDEYITKITPFSKNYLSTFTGLLDSTYNEWDCVSPIDSASEPGYGTVLDETIGERSSFGERSSDAYSESDRDADGSDNDGPDDPLGGPCPHEERRSSERFLRRMRTGHHSPSSRKARRKTKRKHSKASESRVPSSSEDDRETPHSFSDLISDDSEPTPFDPSPPEDSSNSFSALLSTEDPVPSNRMPMGAVEEDRFSNWLRTVPLYSREEENWFSDDEGKSKAGRGGGIPYSVPATSSSAPTGESSSLSAAGHSALKLLSRNVNSIKKKIKRFEEEFEDSFGRKPSHSDKMKHTEVKKHMSDLSKAKKELKRIKDEILDKKSRQWPKAFPISLLRCQESTSNQRDSQPSCQVLSSQSTAETYRQMEECLSQKRNDTDRPLDVYEQTLEQLKDEKADVQRVLLFYESVHGRPSSKEDKELVRPLYDRYRLVKRYINKMKLKQKENTIELAPILEHVVMDFTLASPQHRGSLKEDFDEKEPWEIETPNEEPILLNIDPHPEVIPSQLSSGVATPELNLGDLHALPIQELKERKKEAKEEKRVLRHSLRDFEEKFERETGRKMQKEDRGRMEKTYNEYKHVKAKLRLLEALLSKHSL